MAGGFPMQQPPMPMFDANGMPMMPFFPAGPPPMPWNPPGPGPNMHPAMVWGGGSC